MTPIPPIPEYLQALYEKAKWHNAEITYTSKHKPHPYDNPTTLVTLIERIAKLTAANEELERENTRLKAPVSDEEIEPFGYMPTMRAKFNEIIASRATRTPPQEGQ